MPTPPNLNLEDIMFYEYQILEVTNEKLKKKYAEQILRLLPDWFGKEESLARYTHAVVSHPFFGAFINDE